MLSLNEHSSVETIWMIQKAKNCGQLCGSFITTMCPFVHHVSCSFFGDPGDSAPLQPRFGALWLLTFPKIKITFERKEFSDHWWDSGKYNGAFDGDWENWGPKVPTSKRTEASFSYVHCCLYFVSSSINVSIFHITWLATFWKDLMCMFDSTYFFYLFFLVEDTPQPFPAQF